MTREDVSRQLRLWMVATALLCGLAGAFAGIYIDRLSQGRYDPPAPSWEDQLIVELQLDAEKTEQLRAILTRLRTQIDGIFNGFAMQMDENLKANLTRAKENADGEILSILDERQKDLFRRRQEGTCPVESVR